MRWNIESVKLEALKYNTRIEFQKNSSGAHNYAVKHNLLPILCAHMLGKQQKPRNYWKNKQNCLLEALKYTSRKQFIDKSHGAYKQSVINNWYTEITTHMTLDCNPKYHWCNHNNIYTEAKKYNTKKEFKKQAGTAYKYAIKYNIIDDVCKHMIPLGNKYNRIIYSVIFDDNTIYVGLTSDLNRRKSEHLNSTKSPVYQHINKTNSQPIFELLTEYINYTTAQELESYYVRYYHELNYTVLNKAKTGGLGGSKFIKK